MDRLLYVAMTGASEALLGQAMVSQNLANANTAGFKADLAQFRSMPVFGPGYPSRVYAMEERPAQDFTPGPTVSTGREMDFAVDGDGWIAVLAPDGTEAYTRRGDLRMSVNGLLETGAGHLVLGNGGPVAIPPAEKVDIGADGTVTVLPIGQDSRSLVQADRIKLVLAPPGTLEKGPDGLFRSRTGQPLPADGSVRLASGALEGSNVNAVEALVQMITLSRQFDLQVKMMRSAQENDEVATQAMRLA